jgi:hypothetical protein
MRSHNPYALADCNNCQLQEQAGSRSGLVNETQAQEQQYISIAGVNIPVTLPTVPIKTEVELAPGLKTGLLIAGAVIAGKMLKLF